MKIKYTTLKKMESIFVVISLLLFSGAFIYLLRKQSGHVSSQSAGDPLVRVIFFCIYVITFCLVLRRWKHFFWAATRDKFLLLLLAIALVSVLWSDMPSLTMRRAVALLGTTMFGMYFATTFTIHEQLKLLTWSAAIITVSSLIFALFLPSYGIMSGSRSGNWRGIMGHKNDLGRDMALAAMLFWLMSSQLSERRWLMRGCFALAVVEIFFSRSMNGRLTFIVLWLLLPLYKTLRWPFRLASMVHSGVLLLGSLTSVWLLINLETAISDLGRDASFGARLSAWPGILEMIGRRFWLGHGYSGFWGGADSAAGQLRSTITWQGITHAHNGFLDLGLDLGLLGVSVFTIGFLIAFVKAVKLSRSEGSAEKFWPLTLLTFVLVVNQVSSLILETNNVYWLLYVSVIVSLAKYPLGNPLKYQHTPMRRTQLGQTSSNHLQ